MGDGEMPGFPSSEEMTNLNAKLQQLAQQAPAHLYNMTRGVRGDSRQHQIEIQAELDQMVGLYSVLHTVKLFESHWPYRQWDHQCPNPPGGSMVRAMSQEDLERMLAYRHVRHVAAHGMDGRRFDEHGRAIGQHLQEFETVMASANRIAAVSLTPETITVSPAAVFAGLKDLLATVAQQGSAHAHQFHA